MIMLVLMLVKCEFIEVLLPHLKCYTLKTFYYAGLNAGKV